MPISRPKLHLVAMSRRSVLMKFNVKIHIFQKRMSRDSLEEYLAIFFLFFLFFFFNLIQEGEKFKIQKGTIFSSDFDIWSSVSYEREHAVHNERREILSEAL